MAKKIAVMLDGGHVRVHAKRAGKNFDPGYIEKIGHACAAEGEVIHRIMYYDCPPFAGTAVLPVSGERKTFTAKDDWLKLLSYKELFSVRLGILKLSGLRLEERKNSLHFGRTLDRRRLLP